MDNVDWSKFWMNMNTMIHISIENREKLVKMFRELKNIEALDELNYDMLVGAAECVNKVAIYNLSHERNAASGEDCKC